MAEEKKGLHFFHTFWTKPMVELNRWGKTDDLMKNVYYFRWSVLSLKSVLPNATITLHTDDLGYKLLKELPYDNISIDLNNLDTPVQLWAGAKFKALQNEPLGAIHIDGDVIISKPEFANLINPKKYDLLVQCNETGYPRELKYISPIIKDSTERFGYYAYNCGIVQINNQQLKERYISEYKQLAKKLKHHSTFIKAITRKDSHISFDLLFEQTNLHKICNDSNYKVKTLAKSVRESNNQLPHYGYKHYIGNEKYLPQNLAKAKAAVRRLSSEQ